jgi:hypothetical protein
VNGANEFTFMTEGRFIREGESIPVDDFFLLELNHVTVNANGVVTVDDLTDDTRCR